MNSRLVAPVGFACEESEGSVLLARAERLVELRAAGLAQPEGWLRALDAARPGSGRGATAVIGLAAGVVRLKRLRRGGLAGPLWRDRYAGAGRLLDNLRLPLEVAARGVPTSLPVALLLRSGPGGLWRGFLAVEELEGASDLARLLREAAPVGRPVLAAAMAVVRRMHDEGIEHRDLNLGNILVRAAPAGPEAFVIDLDRARLRAEPLRLRLRARGLLRLERSYLKCLGQDASEAARAAWYTLYAGDDHALAERLIGARRRGRWVLALHRLGGLR